MVSGQTWSQSPDSPSQTQVVRLGAKLRSHLEPHDHILLSGAHPDGVHVRGGLGGCTQGGDDQGGPGRVVQDTMVHPSCTTRPGQGRPSESYLVLNLVLDSGPGRSILVMSVNPGHPGHARTGRMWYPSYDPSWYTSVHPPWVHHPCTPSGYTYGYSGTWTRSKVGRGALNPIPH